MALLGPLRGPPEAVGPEKFFRLSLTDCEQIQGGAFFFGLDGISNTLSNIPIDDNDDYILSALAVCSSIVMM